MPVPGPCGVPSNLGSHMQCAMLLRSGPFCKLKHLRSSAVVALRRWTGVRPSSPTSPPATGIQQPTLLQGRGRPSAEGNACFNLSAKQNVSSPPKLNRTTSATCSKFDRAKYHKNTTMAYNASLPFSLAYTIGDLANTRLTHLSHQCV